MKNYDIEEDLTFLSRPFGLCSHAQYFPEYVAKVLIHEIEQIPQIVCEIKLKFTSKSFSTISG
jgi:hypothetical protein